ncbi:MAG TPA: hypothetical protein VLD86_17080 [Ilumatobacteraceae bacterium]|nr:hypothetical protein [Ilumatobacteraceae bacterium]
MSTVAVIGEGCTTTALGLAAAWHRDEPCIVVELDPAGGCLSAWLDLPRAPGLAEAVAASPSPAWPDIHAAVQTSVAGIDVIVAPTRPVEAAAVVHAAARAVLPVLAALESPVVIADGGRSRGVVSTLMSNAAVVVISHRQHAGSAAAATLGLERVADLVSLLSARSIPTVVALIGQRPYSTGEVSEFVEADAVVELADDPWAAAVFAGRAGSAVRLRRSALMRSLADLASVVSALFRRDSPPVLALPPDLLVEGRS